MNLNHAERQAELSAHLAKIEADRASAKQQLAAQLSDVDTKADADLTSYTAASEAVERAAADAFAAALYASGAGSLASVVRVCRRQPTRECAAALGALLRDFDACSQAELGAPLHHFVLANVFASTVLEERPDVVSFFADDSRHSSFRCSAVAEASDAVLRAARREDVLGVESAFVGLEHAIANALRYAVVPEPTADAQALWNAVLASGREADYEDRKANLPAFVAAAAEQRLREQAIAEEEEKIAAQEAKVAKLKELEAAALAAADTDDAPALEKALADIKSLENDGAPVEDSETAEEAEPADADAFDHDTAHMQRLAAEMNARPVTEANARR